MIDAIDISGVIATIDNNLLAIAAVGGVLLLGCVGVKAFRWVRSTIEVSESGKPSSSDRARKRAARRTSNPRRKFSC